MAELQAVLIDSGRALSVLSAGHLPGFSGTKAVFNISIDSRTAGKGSLFVALRGERTDGHRYLGQAVQAGASVLLVSDSFASENGNQCRVLQESADILIVSDPLSALQDLARWHMKGLPGVERIGITGSTGKTTTKEIVGAVLSRFAPTAVNEGNLNSEIGLPLAVFKVDPGHRYAVFEMGMNRVGEMDILADIVRPNCAAITNVGTAHIGILGSRDAIAAEKKKVFSRFSAEGLGFVYEDDDYRDFLSEGVTGTVLTFGRRTTRGFEGAVSRGLSGYEIRYLGASLSFPLMGEHNLLNALCALSLASELGVPLSLAAEGLESVKPLFGRGEIISGEITLVVDCYNANADSMARSIATVRDLQWQGRKILVLGSMLELGENSAEAHGAVGRLAAESGADAVFLFGEEMEFGKRGLDGAGFEGFSLFTSDYEVLSRSVGNFVRPGDLVLLKGSRGMELERLLPVFERDGRVGTC